MYIYIYSIYTHTSKNKTCVRPFGTGCVNKTDSTTINQITDEPYLTALCIATRNLLRHHQAVLCFQGFQMFLDLVLNRLDEG